MACIQYWQQNGDEYVQQQQQQHPNQNLAANQLVVIALNDVSFEQWPQQLPQQQQQEQQLTVNNIVMFNKEKDEPNLIVVYRSGYEKHKSLLIEGQEVHIIDVDELPAYMNSMPSTLKHYTYYYAINDQSTIKTIPPHPIEIDVIKEHFKLWSIEEVHNSHYVRGPNRIHAGEYLLFEN